MMSFQLGRPSALVALVLVLGAALGLAAVFTFEAGFLEVETGFLEAEAGFLEVEVDLAREIDAADMDDNNVESTVQVQTYLY
jgi:hypothetical protein